MNHAASTAQATKKLLRIQRRPAMHWVGDGFPVHSLFDYNGLGRELSPFLMLDYAAPYQFKPAKEPRGVGAHPHKGFETVTIAYQGEVEHRDSGGGGGVIGPGDVQWMTAGRGIVHEEFHSPAFTHAGGTFQMVQLWVNLRAKDKGAPPAYQTLPKAQIPEVALPDGAGAVRVIAGEFGGKPGPAHTFSPVTLWDVTLRGGKSVPFALPDGHTTSVLVLAGEVEVAAGQTAREGDLAIYDRAGRAITLSAKADAKLLVMGGEPIDEPIVGYGPFVMNTREEIQQAFVDYQMGKMGDLE